MPEDPVNSEKLVAVSQDGLPVVLPLELDLQEFLPIATVPDLTEEEAAEASRLQNAFNVLGPAAGAALVCPGNQVGIPSEEKCPYHAKCVLLKAMKAPKDQLCPIEAEHITNRFKGWCTRIGRTAFTLTEDERSFVADMVWIDIQELRCASIVSAGRESMRLTQVNVKETHPETGERLSWERVIHANIVRLDQLAVQKRLNLREMMLTREQQAKLARWEGKSGGDDLSSLQSARADKLRNLGKTIEAPVEDNPA